MFQSLIIALTSEDWSVKAQKMEVKRLVSSWASLGITALLSACHFAQAVSKFAPTRKKCSTALQVPHDTIYGMFRVWNWIGLPPRELVCWRKSAASRLGVRWEAEGEEAEWLECCKEGWREGGGGWYSPQSAAEADSYCSAYDHGVGARERDGGRQRHSAPLLPSFLPLDIVVLRAVCSSRRHDCCWGTLLTSSSHIWKLMRVWGASFSCAVPARTHAHKHARARDFIFGAQALSFSQ